MKTQRGFTLIEITVSIVAVAILVLLTTSIFAPNLTRSSDPLFAMRAAELGQSYLEEVLGKRFDENSPLGNSLRCNSGSPQPSCSSTPGIDAGETAGLTTTFDDVDDYASVSNAVPRDQSGTVRSGYDDFRVSIAVAYAGTDIGLTNTSAKRIDVTVTDPRGNQYVFSTYKTNF